jgi:hypothetical protein
MTKAGEKIEPVVMGDDFTIQRTYTNVPTGVTITKAWLTIKASDRQIDADALMQLDITTAGGNPNGQITDADTTDGIIAMVFKLPRAKTALAQPNLQYGYDVQVKASDGLIHTMELGTISFTRGRTDAIA